MPETLFEAEEIARTVDLISHWVNQTSNDDNLEKLVKSLLPPNMSEGSLSPVQKISGENVPVLGKITIQF